MSFRHAEVPSTSQESSTALPGQAADGSLGKSNAGANNSATITKVVHWVDMHGYELAEVREFEAR